MNDRLTRAATLIREARLERRPLASLPEDLRPVDEPEAYRLQDVLNAQLEAAGHGRPAGFKIGCTTPVMQAFLGIPNPCSGEVFGPTVYERHGTFVASDFLRPGVECEIAVRLNRTITPSDLPASGSFSRGDVAASVASCHASIEVVDDRYADYHALGTPTLIADDFFNAGEVLGPARSDWQALDLAALEGRMSINGREVGRGAGRDILGHPFEALAWLATAMARRGRTLPAGTFVTLGSLVATNWVEAGDDVLIEIEGLGQARATFR